MAGPGLTFVFAFFFGHFLYFLMKFKNILTQSSVVFITRHSKSLTLAVRHYLVFLFVGRGKRGVLFWGESASTKQTPWYLKEAVRNRAKTS